jgi:hypothetical protein
MAPRSRTFHNNDNSLLIDPDTGRVDTFWITTLYDRIIRWNLRDNATLWNLSPPPVVVPVPVSDFNLWNLTPSYEAVRMKCTSHSTECVHEFAGLHEHMFADDQFYELMCNSIKIVDDEYVGPGVIPESAIGNHAMLNGKTQERAQRVIHICEPFPWNRRLGPNLVSQALVRSNQHDQYFDNWTQEYQRDLDGTLVVLKSAPGTGKTSCIVEYFRWCLYERTIAKSNPASPHMFPTVWICPTKTLVEAIYNSLVTRFFLKKTHIYLKKISGASGRQCGSGPIDCDALQVDQWTCTGDMHRHRHHAQLHLQTGRFDEVLDHGRLRGPPNHQGPLRRLHREERQVDGKFSGQFVML